MRPQYNCLVCGKQFPKQDGGGGTNKFCSHTCAIAARTRTVEQQFWLYASRTEDPDACWNWAGPCDPWGYGRVYVGGRHKPSFQAHRISWLIHNGPIPDGLFVLHSCDNPPCANPKHLFLGTHIDNMQDMVAKGRDRAHRHPETYAKGERMAAAKLTEERVIQCRKDFASGIQIAVLARRENISNVNMGRAVHGDTWKHLPLIPALSA